MALSKKARKRVPKIIWVLIDRNGEIAGTGYEIHGEADADAWGPRFKTYEVRQYALVPKSKTPKPKNPGLGSERP